MKNTELRIEESGDGFWVIGFMPPMSRGRLAGGGFIDLSNRDDLYGGDARLAGPFHTRAEANIALRRLRRKFEAA